MWFRKKSGIPCRSYRRQKDKLKYSMENYAVVIRKFLEIQSHPIEGNDKSLKIPWKIWILVAFSKLKINLCLYVYL